MEKENSNGMLTSRCCFDLAVLQYCLNASSICLGSDLISSVNVWANSSIVATQTTKQMETFTVNY